MRTRFEREALDTLESMEDALAERLRSLCEEFVAEYWEEVKQEDNINEEVLEDLERAFKRTMRYWELRQR